MPINLDKVPSNLQDAVDLLVGGLDADEIAHIKYGDEDAHDEHFKMGKWLRNNWDLWEPDMPLPRWFRSNVGLGHADDMSSIILQALWCKIRGEHFDLEGIVNEYKKHWRDQGVDPLSA